MKRHKTRRHCGNCGNLGSRFTGPSEALFEHKVCNEKPEVGRPYTVAGENTPLDEDGNLVPRCVCDWVDKKSKPRGCPGWKRGTK